MSEYNEFGDYLKKLRLEAGLSLHKLSLLANYDVSNLSKIERGRLPPPPSTLFLKKLLSALGIQPEDSRYKPFIDLGLVSRVISPDDIPEKELKTYLPAFYRAVRNKKDDGESFDKLIELLKKS